MNNKCAYKKFFMLLLMLTLLVTSLTVSTCFAVGNANTQLADTSRPPYYVSPNGYDNALGTEAAPFATITRARDAVRKHLSSMTEDIIVYIMPGDYYIKKTIEFSPHDSGQNGKKVIYKSHGSVRGQARFIGGRKLTGWKNVKDNLWQITLKPNDLCHTLYENGIRARKARLPNHKHNPLFPASTAPYFTSKTGSPLGTKGNRSSWITYRPEEFNPNGMQIGQMKINVFPWAHRNWHRWICSVTGIVEAKHLITFDNLGDVTQILEDARYFLEDHPAFLDDAGEFYLDEANDILYYIPISAGNPDDLNIVMPVVDDIFRIVGDGPDKTVHNLEFQGLSLEVTNAISPTLMWWSEDWGIKDHALVYLKNTDNIELRNCHLKNSGRHGVMMVNQNTNNTVYGCWIEQIGVSGIAMSNWSGGGTDLTKWAGSTEKTNKLIEHNTLTNNKIHDIGQLSIYASCISIYSASYNEISHSEFYNSPRYAITIRGNTSRKGAEKYPVIELATRPPSTDNLFEYLKIYNCGQDSGDMGALHSAMINILNGKYINTYNQITIDNTRAVPDMNDLAPDGIFLDHPGQTMHQVFRNIKITNSQGKAFRTHGKDNESSAVKDYVSWKPEFNDANMHHDRIGLRDDFPQEYNQ